MAVALHILLTMLVSVASGVQSLLKLKMILFEIFYDQERLTDLTMMISTKKNDEKS